MKRLMTAFLLLFITNSLAAQRKSLNKTQSFLSIETGVPIAVPKSQSFPIPLTFEYQRQKKRWALGAGLGLQYDKNSWGDCSKRFVVGTPLRATYIILYYPYLPYCETEQSLELKPSVFGSYYFLQKRKIQVFAKFGGVMSVPIFNDKRGEYYEFGARVSGGIQEVIDAGPISLSNYGSLNTAINYGFLYGVGGKYALNKQIALRFSLQSEWYSDYFRNNTNRGSLVSILGGLTIKI
jgi:hypothetical protein